VQRIAQYLGYLVVRSFFCLAQALPLSACQSVASVLGWLCNDVFHVRGKVVDENLRHAFPHLDKAQRRKLGRKMWSHLFLFGAEMAHARCKIHATNWRDYIEVEGQEAMIELFLQDRPLLLVTAHFGNFELAGYALGLFGYPVYAIARTLDNPYLDRFMLKLRSSTGQGILAKQGDYDKILEILGSGGTVSFLADQYAGQKGCWVEFFNRPASAHKAIALFALDYDAPLAVGFCRRVGRPLHFVFHLQGVADPQTMGDEIGSIRQLTQWYNQRFEEGILKAPEQYWWLHRRWKDRRQKRKNKPAAADSSSGKAA